MDIIHKFEIKTSVEAAYNAVTTEKGINGWWSKDCDIPDKEGETMKVRFTEHNVEMGFKVEELTPLKRVKWLCTENPNPAFLNTTIQFDIEKSEGGVLFTFSHVNWDAQWEGKVNYEQSKQSWEHFMASFKSFLENGQGQPW